jgi:hypothetical protein
MMTIIHHILYFIHCPVDPRQSSPIPSRSIQAHEDQRTEMAGTDCLRTKPTSLSGRKIKNPLAQSRALRASLPDVERQHCHNHYWSTTLVSQILVKEKHFLLTIARGQILRCEKTWNTPIRSAKKRLQCELNGAHILWRPDLGFGLVGQCRRQARAVTLEMLMG